MSQTTKKPKPLPILPSISPGNWTVQPCQADHGETTAICAGAHVLARIPSAAWDESDTLAYPHDRANAYAMAALPKLIDALRSILAGSKHSGRWVDEDGNEVEGSDGLGPNANVEGGRWVPYNEEEQEQWLDTVASMAKDALRAARVPLTVEAD